MSVNLVSSETHTSTELRPNPDARWIGIDRLTPNPRNARDPELLDQDRLKELGQSMREDGILQPLLVRPIEDGQFEVVAGSRRYFAAQRSGIASLPCTVRPMSESTADIICLVENVQREGLDPSELRTALERIRGESESLGDVARKVKKPIDWVSNALGTLENDLVRPHIFAGRISLTAGEEIDRAPEEYQPVLIDAALQGSGKNVLRVLRQQYSGEPIRDPILQGVAARSLGRSVIGLSNTPSSSARIDGCINALRSTVLMLSEWRAEIDAEQKGKLAEVAEMLLRLAGR